MTAMDENGKQAQRKAAMAVLAHSDAAEIGGYLDIIALPGYENSPAAKVPSAMPRSIPSATCRHNATPEAAPCMLMASKG